MMRSPVDIFSDLECGLRELSELRSIARARVIEPEALDAAANQMTSACNRVCAAYLELEQHVDALEDLRDLLTFSYGGKAKS